MKPPTSVIGVCIIHLFISISVHLPFFQGYTNMDNPFGDEHLLDTFHWDKKLEKAGIKGAPKEQIEKLQKQKMIENKVSVFHKIVHALFNSDISEKL